MNKSKRKKEWVRTFELVQDEDQFKVTSWLYPLGLPEASTRLVTQKRWPDFVKLYKNLHQMQKHLTLPGDMPKLTQSIFKRTDNKTKLEQCLSLLNFAAKHPPLYNSQVFLNFFVTKISNSPCLSLSDTEENLLIELEQEPEVLEEEEDLEDLEEDLEESEQVPDYLNEAANVIRKAIECEAEERFDESVACYKKAVGTLLSSLPKDKCLQRQASVKRRIAGYISKAEQLNKVSKNFKKFQDFKHLDLFGNVRDLKRYQIQSILANKVLLATDTKLEPTEKVVIKTLSKASSYSSKTSLLPMKSRFMVKLKRYYETDEELILILEHIGPGPLFSIIAPYLSEQASNYFAKHNDKESAISVITPDPDFAASMMQVQAEQHEHEEDSEDLQVICKLDSEGSDDEELLCLSQAGIEKIQCYSLEQRDKDRFEMLKDHANEVIEKLHNFDTAEDDGQKHLLNLDHLLRTPMSSAPISVPSTAPMSPVSESPYLTTQIQPGLVQLKDIIASFGGQDLQAVKTLPLPLIRCWSVQLIKAVLDLHAKEIYVQDLNPANILLDENGQLRLTYQCQWVSVEKPFDFRVLDGQYIAPEVLSSSSLPAPEADWWSVGVILFEMLTGWSFAFVYPKGLRSHTPLTWSETKVDQDDDQLRDLISQFLHPLPGQRLTEPKAIQKHRFFIGVDWKN